MAEFCKNPNTREGSEAENATVSNNEYRDETVMESVGSIESDSDGYIESDDDLNAIAEGYR